MRHLQDFVSTSNHQADLLTFVSKVMMTYMNNPYPYMDRVADLVSEAVAMTTGEVTARTGKEKLDKKIEGIDQMPPITQNILGPVNFYQKSRTNKCLWLIVNTYYSKSHVKSMQLNLSLSWILMKERGTVQIMVGELFYLFITCNSPINDLPLQHKGLHVCFLKLHVLIYYFDNHFDLIHCFLVINQYCCINTHVTQY